MTGRAVHQVSVGATPGDAITDQALLLRRWLREARFNSDLFAEHIHPALRREVRPVAQYRPRPGERLLVLHHSIGSPVVETLLDLPVEFILVYHNITPQQFLDGVDPGLAQQMSAGRRQLLALRTRTVLALADSPYNQRELQAAGYERTGVLPIALDESRYTLPANQSLIAQLAGSGPLLLFVGRLVPNKKQEDLIQLLYYYRRIEPGARLILVGDPWVPAYEQWLRGLVADQGLQDAVIFAGHVSQPDLVTYYRLADLYVSMSEHEGFGKPLIESMYLGLPVMAYAAASVPETLGGAGILFHRKAYEALAEMVDLLIKDQPLRGRLIARQHERAADFLHPSVQQIWSAQTQTWLGGLD